MIGQHNQFAKSIREPDDSLHPVFAFSGLFLLVKRIVFALLYRTVANDIVPVKFLEIDDSGDSPGVKLLSV